MDTSHAPSSIRLNPTTGQWLLGPNLRTRVTLQRMLLAYALLWALHAVRAVGLSTNGLPMNALWWPMLFDLLWMSGFVGVVRTGVGAKWKDPALTSWQVGFALLSLLISFSQVDVGRSAALPLLAVTLVLGLYQLSERQVIRLGVVSWVLMAACLWFLNLVSAVGIDGSREAVTLVGTGLALPWLVWVARRVGSFRQEYAEQKRALTRTLTRLGELKTHDPLTGLTDHHHMQELLRAECKRHSRNAMTFSLAMLSIDQLQQVNTRYGAAQGDMVIRQLGQLAAQHLRTSDVVARWSSHEFLILMPETDLNGAYRSVERLREFLSTRWGFYSEGKWVPMDCTVGVTHFRAADTIPVLLQRVEQALTDARRMTTASQTGAQLA